MSEAKTYNGWTNYETWNVKLWIDNDEGSCSYWQDAAQSAWDSSEAHSVFSHKEAAAYDLAKQLKSEFEESMPEVEGMWADLLGAALSEVNWDEIAKSMIEEGEFEEDTADDE